MHCQLPALCRISWPPVLGVQRVLGRPHAIGEDNCRRSGKASDFQVIRVLVVDDHEMIRISVSEALGAAGDIEVVGCCVDGQEALGAAALSHPDVVLMDLSMPRMGGVEATRRLLADEPTIRVVIFTSAVRGHVVKDAFAAGAVSCVFKNADCAEVIQAVRAAVA